MITIKVNGHLREIQPAATVAQLLEHLDLDPRRVAVERNRAILTPEDFDATPLQDGDTVEIVHFVGGG